MFSRLAFRINSVLERVFPEQRLYLKSDHGTHYLRLRPWTQALVLSLGALGLAWTIVATSLFMMQTIGAGSTREQSQRQAAMFEERLTSLSSDRDLRAQEALEAQERFNLALAQVSDMQGMLLASEDRRRELETGIDVIQNTLRRTIKERDDSRGEVTRLSTALTEKDGGTATEKGRIRDTALTLDYLTGKLGEIAKERDSKSKETEAAQIELAAMEDERRLIEMRHDQIFNKLEDAMTVSVEPLEKMFRAAGMNPDDLIKTVRRGYSGQGGPLVPISASSMGGALTASETRANAILKQMEEMDYYRIAAFKAPFSAPITNGGVRWTSSYGRRTDPLGAGSKMHEGTDIAGPYGTPIFATAEGTVIFAGWQNGYGRLVKVRHAFGIETRYAHMSQIRVEVGQKVSRGDRIGDMGSSGRSTGNHLHYEIRIDGQAVNPMTFIKAGRNVF